MSAGQLAEFVLSLVEGLRQGPPENESGCPKSRTAGAGEEHEGAVDVQITRHISRIPWPWGWAETRHALMKLRYMTQNLSQQTWFQWSLTRRNDARSSDDPEFDFWWGSHS
jgi:hypothetical protein